MTKIFVYGTLKQHHSNFGVIKSGIFCGAGQLPKSSGFRMVSLGAFPALIISDKKSSQDITGEIWEVDDATFKNVDYLEGYPTFYDRDKHMVLDSEGNKHKCWTYFLPDRDNTDQLKSVQGGVWLGRLDSSYGSGDFLDGIRNAI